MPRFFIDPKQLCGDTVSITGDDAHHISRSLRMAAGEHITVCDGRSTEYDCVLTSFSDGCVTATVCGCAEAGTEPPCHIHLYQALPKGDKLDTVIQKAVECGACEITPFESERCVVRIRTEGEDKKNQRRKRIAEEAAKQCGRSMLPTVHPAVRFGAVLRAIPNYDLFLFCYEGEGTRPLGAVLSEAAASFGDWKGKRIAIAIGSEGGFSLQEATEAEESGACLIGLGKRILRTETASGFVLACLAYVTELG